MIYTHNTEHCFSKNVERASIDKAKFDAQLETLSTPLQALRDGSNKAAKPLLDIAKRQDDLGEIENIAKDVQARFSHAVVAGAGGSGLSGRVLCCLKPVSSTSLHFLETIDPDAINDLLAQLSMADSFFIIVSKSGKTAETLAQFYVLYERLCEAVGKEKAAEHFLVITLPGNNPLRQSAENCGIKTLEHAEDIGGRFSVLTASGLLPAAIAGLDIRAIRSGACSVVDDLNNASSPKDFSPAVGAAIQHGFMEKGRNISVMLPYAERLSGFSSWYRQSWAESLAKEGKGSTPIMAIGTTDQHSQLQLYLDGPKDKLFHIITTNRAGTGQKFTVPDHNDLAYLKGKTTGDIMAAEQKATIETMIGNGCPVRIFSLQQLGEKELGALIMHFTFEILLIAELLCVNPLDQPAVEESKCFARDYLRTGNL